MKTYRVWEDCIGGDIYATHRDLSNAYPLIARQRVVFTNDMPGSTLSGAGEPERGSRTLTAEVRCLGDRWAYRSVIIGEVCPKRVLTLASGTPFMTSQEAKVWRRSWKWKSASETD